MGNIFWVLVKTHLYTLWDPNEAWAFTQAQWEPNAAPTDEVTYPKGPINHQNVFNEYQETITDETGEYIGFSNIVFNGSYLLWLGMYRR